MNFLKGDFAGLPVWAWAAIVGGGGILLALYIKRRQGGTTSGALGQNAAAAAQPSDPNLDPYTGVPYSIEGAINPATGLPAYYGTPGAGTQAPTPTPAPDPLAAWRASHPGWDTGKYAQEGQPASGPDTRTYVQVGANGVPDTLPAIAARGSMSTAQLDALNQSFNNSQHLASGTYVRTGGVAPWEWSKSQATPYWPQMTDVH